MVGLLDIAPLTRSLKIQEIEIEVRGVSARGIASLIARFPEVKALFAGKAEPITAERITALAPEALAAVLACGCGYVGDSEETKRAEAVIGSLSAGDQLEILSAVLELTMPQGAGPFVEKLTALVDQVGGASGKAPGSKSRPESSG